MPLLLQDDFNFPAQSLLSKKQSNAEKREAAAVAEQAATWVAGGGPGMRTGFEQTGDNK